MDVRVVAATNRDLSAMVRQGHFREDLYYRLSTIRLETPPLRERGTDILLLARHFADTFNQRFSSSKRISDEALAAIARHSWPGNVRELLHCIEAAMVVCDGDLILPEHLPAALRGNAPRPAQAAGDGVMPSLEEMERRHIRAALEACHGHRGNAARMLGISERSLYRKLGELGLPS